MKRLSNTNKHTGTIIYAATDISIRRPYKKEEMIVLNES
jgi:hypothetical protein